MKVGESFSQTGRLNLKEASFKQVQAELKAPHPLGSDWGFVRSKMLGSPGRDSLFHFRFRQEAGHFMIWMGDNADEAYVKSRKAAAAAKRVGSNHRVAPHPLLF